jgi:hypothetical protein
MHPTKFRFIWQSGFTGEDFFRNHPIRNKNCLWLKTSGCHPTWPLLLQKIENYNVLSKNILESGKKPVATKHYGNDAYMIQFQTYGC